MKGKRLEEVLDESLSACLEGRRTIEESLSLYPDIRHQLEPLLRTALDLAETLTAPCPASHLQERGRQEFLNSASVRRRARALTQDLNHSRRLARAAWRRAQFGLVVAGFALTFIAVTLAASALDSTSKEPFPQARFLPSPVSPAIGDLRDTQEQLRNQAFDGRGVSPEVIRELAERTTELESLVGEFAALDGRSRLELERAIGYQFLLLRLIVDSQPPADIAPAAEHALGLTEQLADEWGVDLPEAPGATPAPSPSPEPTPALTGGATPSPGPSESPTPTLRPDATPTPQPPSAAPLIP